MSRRLLQGGDTRLLEGGGNRLLQGAGVVPPPPTPPSPYPPLYGPGSGGGGGGPYVLDDRHRTISAEEMRLRREELKREEAAELEADRELDEILVAIYARLFL
jgi:hypothetical protein